MPPSMTTNDDEIPPLTNEDIEILYDIVRLAQTLPGRTFRALFQAYDKVLSERNINPDNDTRYLRFLFRMQDAGEREDEGLVDRFQRLLAEMGIQVECDPEGDGIEEITRNVDNLVSNGLPPSMPNTPGRIRSRRGSFDSFFDGPVDKIRETDRVQDIPAFVRRGAPDTASDTEDLLRKGRSRPGSAARSQLLAQLPIRNRVNGARNTRVMSDSIPSRPGRNRSIPSHESLQIPSSAHATAQQFGGYDGDESEQSDSFERSHIQIPGVNAPIPGMAFDPALQYVGPEMLYRPSDTQMFDDAETFEYRRILTVARTCIRKWREQTREITENLEEINAIAYAFDRRILLRASLDSWRVALQNKHQVVETERFFDRLEGRAEKARNLFLLTKAFTHWAKSAEDEVLRTSVARRHILRTKYFNAWRDITAVNELKIQHHVLGKFLITWRKRTAAVQENDGMAVELYHENLVKKVFWKWFFAFCGRAAPVWNKERLTRNVLVKWVEIVRVLKERENWASGRRNREVLRKSLQAMRQKVADVQTLESQAEEFRRTTLLSFGLHAISTQVKLAPLFAQLAQRVQLRLVQSTLHRWQHNSLLSRLAKNVDRERILRNAFTSWNDQLRISEMARRVNARVQVEALYKWVLASKGLLLFRRHDRALKCSTFSNWVAKTRAHRVRLENAERTFAQFKRVQMLRSCLKRVEQKMAERKGQEFLALSVYEPRLKQRAFENLLEKHDHLQQMETWAEDAQFYVLTKNVLKRWGDATQHARRNRRRETYAHVRRMVKMNLVRRTFGTWKEKVGQLAIQDRQATEVVEDRILRASINLLTRWHNKTAIIFRLSTQASLKYNKKLGTTYFATWTQRHRYLQNLDTQAVALKQENTEIVATGALKKLEWRLWNSKQQEKNALALRQRNFEKHIRAMVRFWWEQTAERLAHNPESPSPTPSPRHGGGADDEGWGGDSHDSDGVGGPPEEYEPGDETRRLENWTAFDEGALGLSNLDLSLSFTPQRRQAHLQHPTRPHPNPQPQPPLPLPPPTSNARFLPPLIQELDEDLDIEESRVWTSTPMPMPKPGYLKTPSKRSVARAKRPELPASPERRPVVGITASAPVPGFVDKGVGIGLRGETVTSFERRLREGGFDVGGGPGGGGGGGGEKGKGAGAGEGENRGRLDLGIWVMRDDTLVRWIDIAGMENQVCISAAGSVSARLGWCKFATSRIGFFILLGMGGLTCPPTHPIRKLDVVRQTGLGGVIWVYSITIKWYGDVRRHLSHTHLGLPGYIDQKFDINANHLMTSRFQTRPLSAMGRLLWQTLIWCSKRSLVPNPSLPQTYLEQIIPVVASVELNVLRNIVPMVDV
ncbi:Sfi1-domain-containing protein [Lindgomyces ingoldianus]|uniref:Sfi1-domain-containing protein n=1 Tax=Lindgomyces ingoldianus TaxID=673940 RepID=A0ACB6RCN0_9PLEO|nr:Sfi1-domain-containing protein [Lindgomyces ingoldianus]KAF2477093.1 Sfi1-domain-containing protein [Lindgomyces ingoldianus]